MTHTVKELRKTCPICKHSWVVRHNHWGVGEVFLRTDFTIAMFDHTAICGIAERKPKAYVYNGGVDEAQDKNIRIL